MLLEPPRPGLPDRAGPPPLTAVPRVRIRRRVPTPVVDENVETAQPSTTGDHLSLRAALLAGAFALAAGSRGDVAVLAVLLAFGAGRRTPAFASAVALCAVMVRWGSTSLRAIAGAQAVLGPAGWTGSNAAVVSSWLAALALVGAARPLRRDWSWVGIAGVVPFAVAAADVVAGPSLGGALALRVVATVIGLAAALVASRWERAPACAAVVAVAALVTAGLAR